MGRARTSFSPPRFLLGDHFTPAPSLAVYEWASSSEMNKNRMTPHLHAGLKDSYGCTITMVLGNNRLVPYLRVPYHTVYM